LYCININKDTDGAPKLAPEVLEKANKMQLFGAHFWLGRWEATDGMPMMARVLIHELMPSFFLEL
jgi:hypothetical protein